MKVPCWLILIRSSLRRIELLKLLVHRYSYLSDFLHSDKAKK